MFVKYVNEYNHGLIIKYIHKIYLMKEEFSFWHVLQVFQRVHNDFCEFARLLTKGFVGSPQLWFSETAMQFYMKYKMKYELIML